MVYPWDLRGMGHVIFVSPKEGVWATHCYLQFHSYSFKMAIGNVLQKNEGLSFVLGFSCSEEHSWRKTPMSKWSEEVGGRRRP